MVFLIKEEDVYDALTHHWQTGNQVRQAIADELSKERFQIPIYPVYVHLDSLVIRGWLRSGRGSLRMKN